VCTLDDPTWSGLVALQTLKRDPTTSYIFTVVLGPEPPQDPAIDLPLRIEDVSRLGPELAKALAL
jgi:hypothetical protein